MKVIGTFEVISGKVNVTDPCYDLTESNVYNVFAKNLPTKNGIYCAFVEINSSDNRIASIGAVHIDYFKSDFSFNNKWERTSYNIGVDSGQAGIFDTEIYPEGKTGEYDDLATFYGKICKLTTHKRQYGIYKHRGVVSSSGYGDGEYTLYVMIDPTPVWSSIKQFMGFRINFIENKVYCENCGDVLSYFGNCPSCDYCEEDEEE